MRGRGSVSASSVLSFVVAVVSLVAASVIVHFGSASHVGSHGEVAESLRFLVGTFATPGAWVPRVHLVEFNSHVVEAELPVTVVLSIRWLLSSGRGALVVILVVVIFVLVVPLLVSIVVGSFLRVLLMAFTIIICAEMKCQDDGVFRPSADCSRLIIVSFGIAVMAIFVVLFVISLVLFLFIIALMTLVVGLLVMALSVVRHGCKGYKTGLAMSAC